MGMRVGGSIINFSLFVLARLRTMILLASLKIRRHERGRYQSPMQTRVERSQRKRGKLTKRNGLLEQKNPDYSYYYISYNTPNYPNNKINPCIFRIGIAA